MNIHHLELFYYVARHGGISRALRHIPYGIQQPAVSGQMLQLEEDLGTRLFERTPFCLTPAGVELYDYVRPFFENMGEIESRLSKQTAPHVRIGASELVLREHLPSILRALKGKHSDVRIELRNGYQPQLLTWLLDSQIDLAITPVEGKPPPKVKCLRLAEVPLVLLVPKTSPIKTAGELWTLKRIAEPLISLPADETLSRLFQKGLKARKVVWTPSLIASSLDSLIAYVASGYGMGVGLDVTEQQARRYGLRTIPLLDFDRLVLMALWQGTPSPALNSLIEQTRQYAEKLQDADKQGGV